MKLLRGHAHAVVVLSIAALAACDSGPTAPAGDASHLWVDATRLVLEPGEAVQVGVTFESPSAVSHWPPNGSYGWSERGGVAWTSLDPGVAKFGATGLVEAVGPGVARLVAAFGAHEDTLVVGVTPIPGGRAIPFSAITAGDFHTCGLDAAGAAYCWGEDWFGELGDGRVRHYTATLAPIPVAGGLSFTEVDAGGRHTCGLAGGRAYCWGDGRYGQLGNGREGPGVLDSVPVAVTGLESVAHISAGGDHTCAVTTGGEAYCWGGGYGAVPERVGAPPLVSIAAGYRHACGLDAAGEAYCWGANEGGQLGDGTTDPSIDAVAVAGGIRFASLDLGDLHSCGVAVSGNAYCWGVNGSGRLGTGDPLPSAVPALVAGTLTYGTVAAGSQHTCAVSTVGAAYCWGSNFRGQLGDGGFLGSGQTGEDLEAWSPVPVDAAGPFAAVTAGGEEHSCAITEGGAAWCWGFNLAGALGTGDWSYFPGTQLRLEARPARVAPGF